jgi:hypothetical protein
MIREAGWIAVILAAVLLVMGLMAPARREGLPTLAEVVDTRGDSATALCAVPAVGPLMCRVRRQFAVTAWQLEAVPFD